MIKRTIEISREAAHLTVQHQQLLIKRDGQKVGSIPCEDIGVVLVDHPGATYSHAALVSLAGSDAALVVCGHNHLPVAVLLLICYPVWWPVAAVTVAFRSLAAGATAGWVLHDPLTARRWYLIPVQDLASFAFWILGFFGNTITWRGRKYLLKRDGTFELRGEEKAAG